MSLACLCLLLVFGGCTAYPGENKDGYDIQVEELEQERSQLGLRIASCYSPIALGLTSKDIIPDESFTASSWLHSYTDFYGAHTARFNLEPLGPWVPHTTDTSPWIQVDLGESRRGVVTGVQTQGTSQDKRVTTFKVKTGLQSCTQYITEATGTPKVFSSSTAATTTHNFPQPVEARFVRIEPTAWAEYGALRFEVLGCPVVVNSGVMLFFTGAGASMLTKSCPEGLLSLTNCSDGWDAFEDGSCFKFAHTASVTYTQADAACQSEGAKLATVHGEREQFFISGDLECYTALDGSDYRGHVSTTKSGYNCQKWTSQSPRSHDRTPENYPDAGLGDHNYCRNPDNEPAPWCYTTDGDRWEACDVIELRQDFCFASKLQKDSSTTDDGYFIGLNDVQTEHVFQWKDGTPLDYTYWLSGEPNGGDQDCVALWPNGDGKWRDYRCLGLYAYICKTAKGTACPTGFEEFQENCYFLDHSARVTFAQAQAICQSKGAKLASIHSSAEQKFLSGDIECFTQEDGADYRGHVFTTEGGIDCQKWTSQTPWSHSRTPDNYPNAGLGDHNYCRNPDGEPQAWCYTSDENKRWDYCPIGEPQDSCIVHIQKDPDNVDDGYFIGLSDRITEGQYKWSDNTEYGYGNWATGQPDNYGFDEDCVAVWPQQDGKWKDDQCTKQFPYICEKRREIPLSDRTVTQSSTAAPASRAVDGKTSTTFSDNSCSQTTSESGPWWMVDQVFNQCVGSIVIYNRQDCCKETLVGAIVRVGDNSNRDSNPACGSPITTSQVNSGSTVEVPCYLRGRYISISLTGTSQLTLCEVKAYLGKCDSALDVPTPFTSAVCTSPAALGMASNQIADSMITTSTTYSDTYLAKYARLDNGGSWTASVSDNNPWIQVDLFGSTDNAVSGLITQGSPGYDEWVTEYTVKLGDQDCALQYIVGTNDEPKVYPANSDRDTKVTNMFPSTVRARYVRVCVTKWNKFASMRLEVLGCRL